MPEPRDPLLKVLTCFCFESERAVRFFKFRVWRGRRGRGRGRRPGEGRAEPEPRLPAEATRGKR